LSLIPRIALSTPPSGADVGAGAAAGAGEAHGAVQGLVAHGNVDLETEAAHEVLLLVAVEDDGVDEADGGLAAVEVEPHGEGQPLALRHCATMQTFDPDHGADWARLLHGDVLNIAEVAFAAWGIFGVVVRAALQDADELAGAGDILPAHAD